ncbi:MAG: PqiC family protein [Zoogloeaceae bacterium]|jgi:cholesterol transport system auxiliary component|nr:PqiC family protein [Zoogloeaceae bacterium]
MMSRIFFLPFFALCLCACSVLPLRSEGGPGMARFDLGVPEAQSMTRPWRLEIRAAGWGAETTMRYRLLYANPAQVMVYARSRWAASPAEVLAQRLEGLLYWTPENPADACTLQLELRRFEQVFATPEQSHGELSVVAALRREGKRMDERIFRLEAPARTPDAAGGVAALVQASDQLALALRHWRQATSACFNSGSAEMTGTLRP